MIGRHHLTPEGAAAVAQAIAAHRARLGELRSAYGMRASRIAIETANAASDALERRETFQIGAQRLSGEGA